MKVEYYLFDPTGNKTILVDTPVPVPEQPGIASLLIEREPETEQVGFLSEESGFDLSLRMAGGEFCGNASMCAAVTACLKTGENSRSVRLKVSGSEKAIHVRVDLRPGEIWDGTVEMPDPAPVEMIGFPEAGFLPVVRFEGIAHVILEEPVVRAEAEKKAPVWCRMLDADALGLLFLDHGASRMMPLVYVPAADTLCWENSCASGTTAAGAFLAEKSGLPLTVTLRQPGGSLTVHVSKERRFSLSGTIRLLRHSYADI